MLSVKEAQEKILSHFTPTDAIFVSLEQALGLTLAQEITSTIDLPPFNNSSVDGFAVVAGDVSQASETNPVILDVIADIPAGSAAKVKIENGQCARIMTGAMLPAGTDGVVMVEQTNANNIPAGTDMPLKVAILSPVTLGENVRKRSADIHSGQKILVSGTVLRPQHIGMLAMLGIASVPVHRKPRVAIVSSGDELVPPGTELNPGKIYDSNTFSLTALAREAGCDVFRIGVAEDKFDSVQSLFIRAAEIKPDLIISSAGVSVGAFDFVKNVLEDDGAMTFWKVNMRPGKPLAFGNFKNIPFFGLPGNPVSSFVSFMLFVEPAIKKLMDSEVTSRKLVRATITEEITSDGRETYLRATLSYRDGKYYATFASHQGSGNLFSLVQANALLIIPSGVKSCAPGSELDAWSLE